MSYDPGPAAVMAETFPLKFGKYVLLKPLARGGMGAIYLAAAGEIGFQKFCVVKKVIAEKTDRTKANRFLDEAKVVLRLSHANLVPTLDAGEVDSEFFIAMELVEGKDLREIWNRCVRTRTRIPLDVALHMVREIARALAYVHSHADLRLVHRDVAPPNILLSYFGEVKLTDFGLARSVLKQENTAPGVVFGRASYLSPEQARGEVADARTDVYSLGIVLWELVTGNQYLQLAEPGSGHGDVAGAPPARRSRPRRRRPGSRPNLDALLHAGAGARARESVSIRRGDAQGALRDHHADLAARRRRAHRRVPARPLRPAMKDERAERDQLLTSRGAAVRAHTGATRASPNPCRCRCRRWSNPATKLQFPKEDDESLGLELHGAGHQQPLPGDPQDRRRRHGRRLPGEHVEIGKRVAIKVLHPSYSRSRDLVERFRREARAASRIGHRNIVDVTDFGATDDGCAYFVMEYLDGRDLADVLDARAARSTSRARCSIAVQICRALAAAHARGHHPPRSQAREHLPGRARRAGRLRQGARLRHRAAAMATRARRRLTNPGMAMGTPEYMAPEQAAGGAVDRAATSTRSAR